MQVYKARLELAVGRGKKYGAIICDSLIASTMARREKDVIGKSTDKQVLHRVLRLSSHTFPYLIIFTLVYEV